MFQRAIRGHSLPKYLSTDHDPLYRFHQWQANLRVLEITELKTVPHVPLSHPFVERLIGTIRREYLDQVLFWSTADLETKLLEFQIFIITIAHTADWKDASRCQPLRGPRHQQDFINMSGGGTVEGCTKRQLQRKLRIRQSQLAWIPWRISDD